MGEFILAQVKAKQHLENPITLFLPDRSPFRVWLAYDDEGNPRIGDALHWRVNCKRLRPELIKPEPAEPAAQLSQPLPYRGIPSTWDGFEGVIRLHLNNEAPRIGCGERGLMVTVGQKQVRLLNHHTGDVGWIRRDVFERLAHKAIEQGRIAPRGGSNPFAKPGTH
ncbi:MAG TPA: hypothetical protein VJV74_06450 [Terriglobia bacterium]|nr:hypothetical protein [Terriglobia bacterium]